MIAAWDPECPFLCLQPPCRYELVVKPPLTGSAFLALRARGRFQLATTLPARAWVASRHVLHDWRTLGMTENTTLLAPSTYVADFSTLV